jgi:hypothetical protein
VKNTNPVLDSFRQDAYDPYDVWGSTISAHFDIAECLYRHGVPTPEFWEFRPSPLLEVGDPLEDDASMFATEVEFLMEQGHITNIIDAGNVLARYAAQLKLAGMDY